MEVSPWLFKVYTQDYFISLKDENEKSRRRAEGPLESDSVVAKAQVTPLLVTQTAWALPVTSMPS